MILGDVPSKDDGTATFGIEVLPAILALMIQVVSESHSIACLLSRFSTFIPYQLRCVGSLACPSLRDLLEYVYGRQIARRAR